MIPDEFEDLVEPEPELDEDEQLEEI